MKAFSLQDAKTKLLFDMGTKYETYVLYICKNHDCKIILDFFKSWRGAQTVL